MTPAEARQRAVEAACEAVRECAAGYSPRAFSEVKLRTEIEAAITAYERAMWRPIAEAPRDGTRVLMYAPAAGGEYPTSTQRVDMWRNGGWWQMRPAQPYTHFRPLPAGPEGV